MMKSLSELKNLFDQYLIKERFENDPKALYEPNNYILSLGGKRLRPLMVLLGCELMGKTAEKALPAALAVEYFHNYTLIHDDIMDDADKRRGKPAVHIKFGTNEAILSGDVLMIYTYQYLLQYSGELAHQLIGLMNKTAIEVCEGQSMDMSFETRAVVTEGEYLEMIRLKTSVLLAASLKMGTLIGGASKDEADLIYSYGENLGLSFQMQDDILDSFGGEAVGKQIGGDILQNKKTLLLIHTLKAASAAGDDTLAQLMAANDSNDDRKIRDVLGLYQKFGAKAYVESKREAYFAKAMEALDSMSHKEPALKEIARMLVYRDR